MVSAAQRSPPVADVARRIIATNHLQPRIKVLHKLSTEVPLPLAPLGQKGERSPMCQNVCPMVAWRTLGCCFFLFIGRLQKLTPKQGGMQHKISSAFHQRSKVALASPSLEQ